MQTVTKRRQWQQTVSLHAIAVCALAACQAAALGDDIFALATGKAPVVQDQSKPAAVKLASQRGKSIQQSKQTTPTGENPFRMRMSKTPAAGDVFTAYAQEPLHPSSARKQRDMVPGYNPFRAEGDSPLLLSAADLMVDVSQPVPAKENQVPRTTSRGLTVGRLNPFITPTKNPETQPEKTAPENSPPSVVKSRPDSPAVPSTEKTGQVVASAVLEAGALEAAAPNVGEDDDIFALSIADPVEDPTKPNPFESGLAQLAAEIAPPKSIEQAPSQQPQPSEHAVYDIGLIAGGSIHRVAAEEVEKPAGITSNSTRSSSIKSSRRPARRELPRLISIHETSLDLTPLPQEIDTEKTDTQRPENLAEQQLGSYQASSFAGNELVRHAAQDYLWMSPMMRHRPLYFEQPNLERYGSHLGGNCAASALATGHFIGRVITLPYQVTANRPRECVYTLGVYRPGSCNPHYLHASPISGRGVVAQAAAVTGLVFLLP